MESCFGCGVVKTKGLISCMLTTQLFYAFVFAYAKSRFSHNVAQMQSPLSLPWSSAYTNAVGIANSVDPDQTALGEQSDLDLHCLHRPVDLKLRNNKVKLVSQLSLPRASYTSMEVDKEFDQIS